MIILNIETSTSVCSAAISQDGKPIVTRVNSDEQNHAKQLPIFIEELLEECRAQDLHLDAVALSQGPGSYTGLRIGTATAKGVCYGLNIPLIPIDTLQIMCQVLRANLESSSAILVPMIDARRMEVYCAQYDAQGKQLTEVEAKVIDEHAFEDILAEHQVVFFGNGAVKCKAVIAHPHALFIDHIVPLAAYMGYLAEEAYKADNFADVAYFDPFYLKEYQAVVSKNKIF